MKIFLSIIILISCFTQSLNASIIYDNESRITKHVDAEGATTDYTYYDNGGYTDSTSSNGRKAKRGSKQAVKAKVS